MIRDYERQYHSIFVDLKLMRQGDTALTLAKYLVYDDSTLIDRIYTEQDRRATLDK